MPYDESGNWQDDQPDSGADWFASNSPPQVPVISPRGGGWTGQADPNSGILRSIDPTKIPGQPGYYGNAGVVGPARGQGFSGNVQDLWNQYRSSHPEFHPTQGAATSLSPFVEWAKSQGANISLAGPASGGYVKGITDQNGQFVKLLNGSDQPIWLPGGDAPGSGGQGQNPYSYQSFDQTFTAPTWDKTFTAPTLEQARNEPGYQFVQQQGEQGILRNAAKMGIARTQGTVKDLDQFNTGLADTTYQNVYGRAADQYNKELNSYLTNLGVNRSVYDAALQKYGVNQGNFYQGIGTEQAAQGQAFGQQYSLANLGLSATNASAGLYANQGSNIANIYGTSAGRQGDYTTQIGNANAAGQVGSANAWQGAFGNIGNDLSTIYANQGKGIYRYPQPGQLV